MKKNQVVIDALNHALIDVSGEIFQYMIHSEMCDHWEYEIIHRKIENRALETMKHTQSLIAQIVWLQGIPKVKNPYKLKVGKDAMEILVLDLEAVNHIVENIRNYVQVCVDESDNKSAKVLEMILNDKLDQKEWLEDQQKIIEKMGKKNYFDWALSFLQEI